MTITWQTVITFAAVLGAIAAILRYYNRGYDFVKRQNKQDEQIAEIKEEQAILTRGMLACLKGLHEQGANGPVTEGINEIEDYLNRKAHK